MHKGGVKLLNNYMTNIFKTRGYPWNPEKLILIRDFYWTCPKNIHGTWTSKDNTLTINNDQWTIATGYTYNACTWVPSGMADTTPNLPVVSMTNQPIPILWKTALIHDKGYESLAEPSFPFKRSEIDTYFYVEASQTPFIFSKVYWIGVRIFGFPIYLANVIKNWFK